MLAKFASLVVSEAAPVVIPVMSATNAPLSNTSICSVALAGAAAARIANPDTVAARNLVI